jgi:PAS domain S-box-containing protein
LEKNYKHSNIYKLENNSINDNLEVKYLTALFDNSTIGMVICNLEGDFLTANNQFVNMIGYSKEELCNKNFRDITHPDDLKNEIENARGLIKGNSKNFEIEKRYITKEKKTVWAHLLVSVVVDSENIPEAIIGIVEDITDRKNLLKQLEESKFNYARVGKLLQSIQDAIPDIIGVQDTNHNIVQYNKAGYQLLNKTYGEVVGQKCYHLIGRDNECELCSTVEAIKTKKPARHEQFFEELGIWLDMRAYPILDEHGEIIYIVEHLRDISDIKNLEQELNSTIENFKKAKIRAEESDKLKTAFLHNISHEIRTPLNGIIGFSTLLKEKNLPREKISEYADLIIQSGWQLSNIINDLVAIATIETGQEKLRLKDVNVYEFLKSTYSSFKIKASEKRLGFSLKANLDERLFIKTDETKLYQIISNLITNAIKFTNKGYIEFGAQHSNNQIVFYVKDTGIGITQDNQSKVFERFVQIDSNASDLHKGSGLGLAITKAYIELMGGKIWLESELSKGSTFYFNIPLYSGIDTQFPKPLS